MFYGAVSLDRSTPSQPYPPPTTHPPPAMSAILVTNVAPAAQESHLREFFQACGAVESVDFENGADASSKYCTIVFALKAGRAAPLLLTLCARSAHPPHPPPWLGRSFHVCLLVVH
jgi:hypothetical protein